MRNYALAVEAIRDMHVAEFAPAKREIRIPKQPDLWGKDVIASHVSLGYFYELVINCLFGGKVLNHIYLPNREENESGVNLTKPDVVTPDRILESKASRTGRHINLWRDQVNRYKRLQTENLNVEVHYAAFRHNFKAIMSYQGTEEELYRSLATEHTISCVMIPLRLVCALNDSLDVVLVRQYNKPNTYGSVTKVTSPTINGLMLDPAPIINELGFDPAEFEIERYISPKVIIDNNIVRSFPLTVITDIYNPQFARELDETFDEDIPF